MGRAGPVVEACIEENKRLHFIKNRPQAQKRNAVELKTSLMFPKELLVLLGNSRTGQVATLEKITCLHMFETMPQSKCAVAYEINSPKQTE